MISNGSFKMSRLQGSAVPSVVIVPPVLVITPQAPTLCLVNEFWMAEYARPTPPVIIVALSVAVTASCGR